MIIYDLVDRLELAQFAHEVDYFRKIVFLREFNSEQEGGSLAGILSNSQYLENRVQANFLTQLKLIY